MTSTQWRPVADGTIPLPDDWGGKEAEEYEDGLCAELSFDGKHIQVRGYNRDSHIERFTFYLPDHLRLCERVDAADDAITPDALKAAGWEYDPSIGTEIVAYYDGPEIEDSVLDKAWTLKLAEHSLARRAKTMHVYFSEYLSGETISVLVVAYSEMDDMEMAFDGCTTMSQLAQLVAMLGGEA